MTECAMQQCKELMTASSGNQALLTHAQVLDNMIRFCHKLAVVACVMLLVVSTQMCAA